MMVCLGLQAHFGRSGVLSDKAVRHPDVLAGLSWNTRAALQVETAPPCAQPGSAEWAA
jgi:hypothetical protein